MNTVRPYMSRITIALVALFVLFGTTTALHAQNAGDPIQITESDMILTVTPSNPEPNTNVTVTLNSYVVNVNNRMIQWFVNGALIEQGTGKDTFTFNSGSLGTRTRIDVIVATGAGNTVTKSIAINPIGVDLLWEATDAYAPPFYKGKKIPAPQAAITVMGIPITAQGRLSDQKDSVYYWSYDYDADAAASGYGKRAYVIKNSALNKAENVQVTIASASGSFQSTKEITVPTQDPQLVFYKKNSNGMILWNRGYANNASIPTDANGEANIVAEPYFFSTNLPFALDFTWRNQSQTFPETSISTRAERLFTMSTRGSTRISVQAENKNVLLQAANAQLQLVY